LSNHLEKLRHNTRRVQKVKIHHV